MLISFYVFCAREGLTKLGMLSMFQPQFEQPFIIVRRVMKVVSSLKTLKSRDRNCQVVRRKGRLYVINKKNPRLKARQG